MPMAFVWNGTDEADTFIFRHNFDNIDSVSGGAGDDYIADSLYHAARWPNQFVYRSWWSQDGYDGGDGNDTIVSRSGPDSLYGGAGDDRIKVRAAQFNAGAIPGAPSGPRDMQGFDVTVDGGEGYDVLTVTNSRGYHTEVVDDVTYITTRFGGVITVTGIEEFHFI